MSGQLRLCSFTAVFGGLRLVGAPGDNSRLPARIFGRNCDTNKVASPASGSSPQVVMLFTRVLFFTEFAVQQQSSAQSSSPAADTAPIPFLETLRGTALIRNASVSALLNCEELICMNRSKPWFRRLLLEWGRAQCPKERRGRVQPRHWGCWRGSGGLVWNPTHPPAPAPSFCGNFPRKGLCYSQLHDQVEVGRALINIF